MDDKRVCISGCTRGLGRALAEWFLEQGWHVGGFGRNARAVTALSESAPAGPTCFRVVDVRDAAAVAAFAVDFSTTLGAPDLLINNAGLINPVRPLWEIEAEDFDAVVDVNLKGVANCLRQFAPQMIRCGKGIMINLSSGWGRSTSPRVAPYCATKWAVEGLSQAMAQELPKGVAVAALNPGIIDTDMLRTAFGESAANHDDVDTWVQKAGPFLAQLTPACNGRQLTI